MKSMDGAIMDESRAVKNDLVDVTNGLGIVKTGRKKITAGT